MSTLTVATATATFRRYQTATPEQDYAFAQSIRFLNAADPKTYSLNGLLKIAEDLSRKVSRTRLGVILRTVKALDADFTMDAYQAALKEQTDKNRGTGATEPTEPATEATEPTVPQGNTSEPIATVTDAVRALWLLVETFGGDCTFDAALAAANDYVNTDVVLIATPVAA